MANLNSKHLEDLRKSTLTDETIAKYDFSSITAEEATNILGFKVYSNGWLLHYPNSHFLKFKPDEPIGNSKKKIKYVSPVSMTPDLLITHLAKEKHQDIKCPYYFIEGEKKSLAMEQLGCAAISICGVWGWVSQGHISERLTQLNLSGRACKIVFDSDKYSNKHVKLAEDRLAKVLKSLGAIVKIVNLRVELGKGIDDQIKRAIEVGNLNEFKQQYLDNAQSYDEYKNKSVSIKDGLNPVEIANKICKENNIIFCAEGFYAYRGGVYKYIEDTEFRQIILQNTGAKISFTKLDEIFKFAKICVYKESEKLNNSPLLNLRNGLFDIDTYELLPHSASIYSTIQLNVNYNPVAKCDTWIKTLKEVFPNEEEKIQTLQEFFGLCLTRETKYEKTLLCVGEGATGKSVVLNILEHLIGKENCTAVPLEKFCDAHYLANLFGKLANISIETNAKAEVYDSMFKAIISGDSIQADLKFKPAFKFQPFCKLIFATNNLPRVDDKTTAFYRRLLIMCFEREFSESEANKNLKLHDERNPLIVELDGIFNWCLEGLKRLRERGYFNVTARMQEAIEEYKKENNYIIVFVEDECFLGEEYSIEISNLYKRYTESCKDNGHKPYSQRKFGRELLRQYGKTICRDSNGNARIWKGIDLKSPLGWLQK